MKANLSLLIVISVASVAALPNSDANAEEQPTPSADVQIERDVNGAGPFVVISNTADQVWSLERSPDRHDWTSVATLRIHNGQARHSLAGAPLGTVEYFRAFYDPLRQDNVHEVSNAL